MMNESSDLVNAEINQEDNGYYYGRPTDIPMSNMNEYQMTNNYVQNYQPKDENIEQQILKSQNSCEYLIIKKIVDY